jgi:hypothetical protein
MQDLNALRPTLTPQAREWLQGAQSPYGKFRLLAGWSMQAIQAGLGQEKLFELAAKDLPAADREHYEKLSTEQRQEWLEQRLREESNWRRSGRFGPGDRSRRGFDGPRGKQGGRRRPPQERDHSERRSRDDRI